MANWIAAGLLPIPAASPSPACDPGMLQESCRLGSTSQQHFPLPAALNPLATSLWTHTGPAQRDSQALP